MEELKKDILISVIVPVYNVEKYLGRCVESLINQSHKNLEIILVNDGTKDSSGKICDKYALQDGRIKVIHKENGGLSDARNKGIEIANGDFIGFVDSDDYVATDMYEKLLNIMLSNDSDIAMCRYKRFKGQSYLGAADENTDVVIMDTQTALENIYGMDGEIYTVAWNKLYKREVIADIRYPIRKLNEDEFTTYKFMANAKKIAYTSESLYYYFYNDNSITTNDKYALNEDVYEAFDERIEYLKQKGFPQFESMIHKQYLVRIIMRNKTIISKKLLHMYRERYKKADKSILGLGFKIYGISPRLYYLMLKIKK